MRKFLFSLLAVLAWSASAETVVPVVWPFSLAGAQSNMIRQIIDNANATQTKYKFVYDNKPGAGGSVAVNSVIGAKELKVLVSTTSFYIRPVLYQNSYNPQDFSLLARMCAKQPFAVFSKKYKTVGDMVGKNASIGAIPGTMSQLVSLSMQKHNNLAMIDIGYKGTPEAIGDVLGGHLDAGVDFFGPLTMARFSERDNMHVLGITGDRNIAGLATFKSQNIKGLDALEMSTLMFVKNTTDDAVKKELANIFNAAMNDQVKKTCVDDYGMFENIPYEAAEIEHTRSINHWSQFVPSLGIKAQ